MYICICDVDLCYIRCMLYVLTQITCSAWKVTQVNEMNTSVNSLGAALCAI